MHIAIEMPIFEMYGSDAGQPAPSQYNVIFDFVVLDSKPGDLFTCIQELFQEWCFSAYSNTNVTAHKS